MEKREAGPGADEEALRCRIAARAYGLWEQEGCPHGRDLEFWLRAEAEIAIGPDDPPNLLAPPGRKRKRTVKPEGQRRAANGRPGS